MISRFSGGMELNFWLAVTRIITGGPFRPYRMFLGYSKLSLKLWANLRGMSRT